MPHNPNAIHEKANQAGNALCSFVFAAIAAYLLWTFGEPVLIRKFGSGAPWWVYVLPFVRSAGELARMLADEPATQDAADDCIQGKNAAPGLGVRLQ